MLTLNETRVAVLGLGYVGLPLACLFASHYPTVGFDLNPNRVDGLKQGIDSTGEVSGDKLRLAFQQGLQLTSSVSDIASCNVYIVAVPTPVDVNNHPDLEPLLSASHIVGEVISRDNVVIYESTVYPGVTEEECLPQVQQVSHLVYNKDFFAGYSPERINPGDKEHSIEQICKVTSGSTPEVADFVDQLYASVLVNGTFKVSSIRVAEASKIVENAQRDVNIAFMNELAKIFNAMNIDTHEVIEAASTKWNFIKMSPGLVGGHCISVDPYYLIEKAQVYGVMTRVISSARHLNDSMGSYVANQVVKTMNLKGVLVKDCSILIMGFSFKEKCSDTRNTKVYDIYETLSEYTKDITVYDPWVNREKVQKDYGLSVCNQLPERTFDVVILAVAHPQFLNIDYRKLVPEPGIIYDVKGILPRDIIDARL